MAEYIEREAAIEAIMSEPPDAHYPQWYADKIKAISAADVAPVRHGRWKCNKPFPVCGRDRFEGLDADIWADWEPQYCPNCGAKMDKEMLESEVSEQRNRRDI